MGSSKLLGLGLGLMRHLSLGGKLALVAVLSALPLVFVLWQVVVGDGSRPGPASLWVLCGLAGLLVYFLVAFYLSVTLDLGVVVKAVDRMVAGDLRQSLTASGRDELGQLVGAVGQLGRTVSAMVANVRSNAAFVNHAGKSLARGSSDLSDRTEQQAANLEQTAASVEELSSTVQENANTASRANQKAGEVRDVADQGAATMVQAVESVEAIQASAKRMDEIVGVIDGLAFQTNILALNAAVEAARAGESGRGFAVVATEVRSLAQRSAEASKEIRLLISTSSSQVASSVQKIRAAGTTINQVVGGIRDVAASMSQISTSSAEQSSGLSEITSAVRQLDEITQRNAQMVEQAVTQAVAMEGRASTLVESVALFKLQQGSAEEALALVQRAVAHRQHVSKETFLRDVTDATKGFMDRDMYVFVLDDTGRYLAFGGNPAKVGTRLQDIPGIDGQGLLQSIIDQADYEPGWVEYNIANPTTGKVQAKMSFVQKVDGLYVGCGVYKNLVQA
ncbi:cache domain-containing protein [Rhodoferax sp. AJA081-3]|uniref:methyl-accepting chemotaxis protein n=1 Tax=Rhodoferax sp. AJA081-3 TaxID=2752316 RepID=UPI001AE071FC|nr:methyl-accepting chemotaxis protein [Rhodoferax sp. AJA081-3]QTN29150.1 cache domain-containing protein [Rhodoferax sp. AJA081-3]